MSRVRADNAGNVLLNVEDVSLAFGGVKALQQVSFDVFEHEIRAIIGPNGAGSSMLNVINGVYTPQHGRITFLKCARTWTRTRQRRRHRAYVPEPGAVQGNERARQHHDRPQPANETGVLLQAVHFGPAKKEELRHREYVEHIIDFLEIQAHRKTPVGRLPYGLQKRVDLGARSRWSRSCSARRADGRHEPRRERGHVPLRAGCERRIRHNDRVDRHDRVMDISDESLCSTTARRSAMVRRMKYETARRSSARIWASRTDDMRTICCETGRLLR